MSDNAYINDLETRLAEAEKQLAEAKEHIGKCRNDWDRELITRKNKIESLQSQLTAANATIAACKEAAENAIDNAGHAMDQDESWARLHAGLRDVIAAAKEAQ